MAVVGLNTLFIFAGMSGFELLPVFAKNEAGVSETAIGTIFFVNTVVIVLAQLPISKRRRDTGGCGCWPRSACCGRAAGSPFGRRGGVDGASAAILFAVVDGLLRHRRVHPRRRAGATRLRPRRTAPARALHGAVGALLAARLRPRTGVGGFLLAVTPERHLAHLGGDVHSSAPASPRLERTISRRGPPHARCAAGVSGARA